MKIKRYLKFHLPEIEKNENLPVNIQFTQFYAGNTMDKNGEVISVSDPDCIEVDVYQLKFYNLSSNLSKPISKIVSYED